MQRGKIITREAHAVKMHAECTYAAKLRYFTLTYDERFYHVFKRLKKFTFLKF